jgi:ketosteroid isomerase-like protein
MKRFLLALACAALLGKSAFGAAESSVDRREVAKRDVAVNAQQRALLDRFHADHRQSFLRGELEPMAAHWAEAVRMMPEYHPTLLGQAEARAYYRAWFAHFEVTGCERTTIDAIDLGSKLIEIGRFALTVAVKGQSRTHELNGKYLEIWDETADGGLELATVTWNFDRYPAIAEEFRFTGLPGVRQAMQAHLPIRDAVTFELGALLKLHEAAVVQRDDRVWAMHYADDAVLLGNHQPVVAGRSAIDAHFARYVKDLSVFEKLDLRNDRADILGDHVIEYGSHVANWRRGDESGVNTGKAIRVWRREPHGGLRILWSISMYD